MPANREKLKVKEKYGLVYSAFFPVASEPSGSHPVYGEEIDLGAAVRAYLTITYATAQAYGDDRAQLDVKEFVSAQLDAETLLSDLEVDAALFGSKYADGTATDSIYDTAKPGGYAYIQKLKLRSGGTVYRAVFLYYATPSLNADNADTRNASITFMNNSITCSVLADSTGDWRARHDCGSEAEAKEWIAGLVKATAGGAFALNVEERSGKTVSYKASFVNSGEAGDVEFAEAPSAVYDNGENVTASLAGTKYTIASMTEDHSIVAFMPKT